MDDEQTIGRILSRREMLMALGGLSAAALLAGCSDDGDQASRPAATAAGAGADVAPTGTASSNASAAATALPACIVVPALTEGPYFVDEQLNRSDIRSDPGGAPARQGVELTLTLNVLSVAGGSCAPMSGATVDVWHCDALGAYSDVVDTGQGFNTRGQKWLRGLQATNANGQVKFTTIYPGWYQGRATHIHFKVRKDNKEFTSQFFFDDKLSDQINDGFAPYSQKGSRGRQQNAGDGIYRQSNGMLQLDVQKSGSGYVTTFDIGMQS